MNYLKARHWIDEKTDTVSIIFTVYNGELSLFSELIMKQKFERGGYIRSSFVIGSTPLHPYEAHPEIYYFDAMWIFMLFCLLIRESLDYYRRQSVHQMIQDPWSLVSLITVAYSVILIVIWHGPILAEIEYCSKLITESAVIENGNDTSYNVSIEAENVLHHDLEVIQDKIALVIEHINIYRWGCCVNVFLLLFQLFDVFVSHPRLAVVLVAFSKAVNDIGHFLFVFFFIFSAYSYTGHVMYGHQLEDFASLEQSVVTCFLMLIGDGVDVYEEIKDMAPVVAFIWWFSFLVFGMLTMLQMLIAIILDNYASAQSESLSLGSGSSLLTQFFGIFIYSMRLGRGKCCRSKASPYDFYILLKYRVAECKEFGIWKKNVETKKLERWVCAADLVNAGNNWVYPAEAKQMGSFLYMLFQGRENEEKHMKTNINTDKLKLRLKRSVLPWQPVVKKLMANQKKDYFPALGHDEAESFLKNSVSTSQRSNLK